MRLDLMCGPKCGGAGLLIFGGPRSCDKRGFTKMALTRATGVRFGRATRRIDRESEAPSFYKRLRWFGSLSRPKNAYFYEIFIVLCFYCF
ncbi:hypothetical protein Hanom_Chr13g01237921 [Helianthus anomalus]